MALDKLYIIDFSFGREDMLRLHQQLGAENVVLLDHHITAKENLSGVPNCHIDLSHSGAVLAWQHFFPGGEVPTILKYVEDRDLWRWDLTESKAVSAYLASWDLNVPAPSSDTESASVPTRTNRPFIIWDSLTRDLETEFENVVVAGRSILRAQQQLVKQICEYAYTIKIDGHEVPTVHSGILQSDIGELLLEQHPDAPFAAIHITEKEMTRWSLRSREGGHNVAETARRLGGGGHPAAAGFTTQD